MKRCLTILLLASLFLSACVTVAPRKYAKKIVGQTGRNLPHYGVSVDANYDPRLDDLISPYKLLTIVMRNTSLRAVPMDVKKDRWVVVGEKGKKYPVINSLRVKDPVAWRQLPDRLRTLMDYPEVIPINYSVTFDLILPARSRLEYFSEIRYYNAAWRQAFVIEKGY